MKPLTMIDINKDNEPFLIEFSEIIVTDTLDGETKFTRVEDETTDDD